MGTEKWRKLSSCREETKFLNFSTEADVAFSCVLEAERLVVNAELEWRYNGITENLNQDDEGEASLDRIKERVRGQ